VFNWLKKVFTFIKIIVGGKPGRRGTGRQTAWYADFAMRQSRGKKRPRNEDSLYADSWQAAWADATTTAGLYLVADGMGGHANGQLASKTAMVVFTEDFKAMLPSINQEDGLMEPAKVDASLRQAILTAHQAVQQRVPGGGTTLTAVYLQDGQAWFIHAGDSRAYLFPPGGEPRQITTDHSLVQRLVESGQLFPERAALDPRRNILYRALGQAETFLPDSGSLPIPSGSTLLLCSDGLWGSVSLAKISELLAGEDALQLKANRLVDAANQAGGPDNISVCLVTCWQEDTRR
jgi:serine/threonine protein phosphatase PrpC